MNNVLLLIGGGLANVSIVALVITSNTSSDTPLQKIRNVYLPAGQKVKLDKPQISGWVAWWKEEEAYALIASNPEKLHTVSPVWFLIDEQFRLKEVREYSKEQALLTLRTSGLRVIPTVGSELTGAGLSPIFVNDDIAETIIRELVDKSVFYQVDGIDVDLEGIDKTDHENFASFLKKLTRRLKSQQMKTSVTVHAQTGSDFPEGTKGQDLKRIGGIAGEVGVMAYDKHGPGTGPGPITPEDWLVQVVGYTLDKVTRDKVVIGLPIYGYIWKKNSALPKGLQYDEFNETTGDGKYFSVRDQDSGELRFLSSGYDYEGWLADHLAVEKKIDLVRRRYGINRFIL